MYVYMYVYMYVCMYVCMCKFYFLVLVLLCSAFEINSGYTFSSDRSAVHKRVVCPTVSNS